MYSQKENKNVEFEHLENHLYKTEIIEVNSINQTGLQKKFKKIASRLFVNLDKIIVNETENQIVLNYILTTKNLPITSWNVRIVSEFKDSRMRLQIYDLGNVYIPSGQYTPTWNESSFYVTNNKRATKRRRNKIMSEWMQSVDNLIEKLKNELNKPIKKDDW
jgi:phosphoribosyl-dephospho-CoA transferase